MVGEYRDHRFTPEVESYLDTHPMASFHCARTLLDPGGRRIMFGVLAERRLVADNPHGWAGVLSLPRVLGLGEGNRLLMDPAPEVCSNGEPDWEFPGEELAPDRPFALDPVHGDCLEMVAEIDPGSAREVGLKLRRSAGGEEVTAVRYDRHEATLGGERRRRRGLLLPPAAPPLLRVQLRGARHPVRPLVRHQSRRLPRSPCVDEGEAQGPPQRRHRLRLRAPDIRPPPAGRGRPNRIFQDCPTSGKSAGRPSVPGTVPEPAIDLYPYNHILTHMKTTIELPDNLLRAAKAMAVRRGTTLKAIITHALEREVHDGASTPAVFELDEDGLPHLPPRGARVTAEIVGRLLDEEAG